MWPAAIICGRSADKIGVDVDIATSSVDNNTLKQTTAWETFNIRQELALFGLHSYANIVEIFHVLGPDTEDMIKLHCLLW